MNKTVVTTLIGMGLLVGSVQAADVYTVTPKLTVTVQDEDTVNGDVIKYKSVKTKAGLKEMIDLVNEVTGSSFSKKAKFVYVENALDELGVPVPPFFALTESQDIQPIPFDYESVSTEMIGNGKYNDDTGASDGTWQEIANMSLNTDIVSFTVTGINKITESTSKANKNNDRTYKRSTSFKGVGVGDAEGSEAIVEGTFTSKGSVTYSDDE